MIDIIQPLYLVYILRALFHSFDLAFIYRFKDVIYNVSDNRTRLMLTIHVKSKDNLWFASQISSKITSFCKKVNGGILYL